MGLDHDQTWAPSWPQPSPLRSRIVVTTDTTRGEWDLFWASVLFNRRRNPNPFPRIRLFGRRRG